jgi:hypothetical protein
VRTASIAGSPQAWTRTLLRCGLAAGPVFITAFLLEGAVRDGYRPLRHPVSSLALGSRGWIQTGNFAVAGTLFLAGAAGLARAGDPAASSRVAPALIGGAGAGLIGAAVFPTDPVSGYPPGTPDAITRLSPAGAAHNVAAIPVFLGLPAAALACGWRSWRGGQRGSALYSRHHAGHYGPGRCGLRPVTPPGPSRRAVPAGQHHHRLHLAHRPVRPGPPARGPVAAPREVVRAVGITAAWWPVRGEPGGVLPGE